MLGLTSLNPSDLTCVTTVEGEIAPLGASFETDLLHGRVRAAGADRDGLFGF